jgi:hypothetical protein
MTSRSKNPALAGALTGAAIGGAIAAHMAGDEPVIPDPLPRWCFTFGSGSPLARYYVEIDAKDEMQARARMIGLFSQSWAGIYTAAEFQEQIGRFDLLPLEVNKRASQRLVTNHHNEMPEDLYRLAYPWE